MGCFRDLVMLSPNQLKFTMNFLCGVIHNLDVIELGNNSHLTFLLELFHMLRDDNF
jgi:hypothetical protein